MPPRALWTWLPASTWRAGTAGCQAWGWGWAPRPGCSAQPGQGRPCQAQAVSSAAASTARIPGAWNRAFVTIFTTAGHQNAALVGLRKEELILERASDRATLHCILQDSSLESSCFGWDRDVGLWVFFLHCSFFLSPHDQYLV